MGGGKGEKIVRGSPMVLADAIYPLPHLPTANLCHLSLPLDFQPSILPDLQPSTSVRSSSDLRKK